MLWQFIKLILLLLLFIFLSNLTKLLDARGKADQSSAGVIRSATSSGADQSTEKFGDRATRPPMATNQDHGSKR